MCMFWLVVDHIWGEHKMAGTRWQPTQLRPTPTMMIKWWSMSSEKNAFAIFEILHLGNTIVNCSMRWAECVLLCLVVVDESFQRRQPFLFYIIQPGRAWRLTEATKYTACQFCLEASFLKSLSLDSTFTLTLNCNVENILCIWREQQLNSELNIAIDT